MAEKKKALPRLTDNEVRLVNLPPATVASLHIMGPRAELEGQKPILDLIQRRRLAEIKPDLRHFGFNHPDGKLPDGSDHGYERWITIPHDMTPDPPFKKLRFQGGLYAAYRIPMGAFSEWERLSEWVTSSDTYEYRPGDWERMHGLLEEHLDPVNTYTLPADDSSIQIDLLTPVRKKR